MRQLTSIKSEGQDGRMASQGRATVSVLYPESLGRTERLQT